MLTLSRLPQLPGFIFSCLQTLLAIVFYLDARFSIHQRLAVAFGIFLEGLVEIEKEVGLLRNAGEALSVGWCVRLPLYSDGALTVDYPACREATVKGIIGKHAPSLSQDSR